MDSATDARAPDSGFFAERGRWFWAVLGVLVTAQLAAMWLVCSHQVRKAETRRAETQVQQMALADCLEYIPGATIATCSAQLAATRPAAAATHAEAATTPATAGGTQPVSFVR